MTSRIPGNDFHPIEQNNNPTKLQEAVQKYDAAKRNIMNGVIDKSQTTTTTTSISETPPLQRNKRGTIRIYLLGILSAFRERLPISKKKGVKNKISSASLPLSTSTSEHLTTSMTEHLDEPPIYLNESDLTLYVEIKKTEILRKINNKNNEFLDRNLEEIGKAIYESVRNKRINPENAMNVLKILTEDPAIDKAIQARTKDPQNKCPILISLLTELPIVDQHYKEVSDEILEIANTFFSQPKITKLNFSDFVNLLTDSLKHPLLIEKIIQISLFEIANLLDDQKISRETAMEMVQILTGKNPITKEYIKENPEHFSNMFELVMKCICNSTVADAARTPAEFVKFLHASADNVNNPLVFNLLIQSSLDEISYQHRNNHINDQKAREMLAAFYAHPRIASLMHDKKGYFSIDPSLKKVFINPDEIDRVHQDNIKEFLENNAEKIDSYFAARNHQQNTAETTPSSVSQEEISSIESWDSAKIEQLLRKADGEMFDASDDFNNFPFHY